MAHSLKPVQDQTIVITGASSGIGLTTARLAAEHGTRLVLAGRSERALQQLVDEIEAAGGEALRVVADVRRADDVERIADGALERFGGFDTWVNNVRAYGALTDVPVADMRGLFETNFWEHLKHRGGALVNGEGDANRGDGGPSGRPRDHRAGPH